MGFQNILLPLDGSELGQYAIEAAIQAAAPHATVHILSVVTERPEVVFSGYLTYAAGGTSETIRSPQEVIADIVRARKEYLDDIRAPLERAGLQVKTTVEMGEAVSSIIEAIDEKIDLIVMATHGRTGLNRLLLGSVAEGVLHQSTCPVLLVTKRRT
jgi:nucleotide-binding universal stress UspA family protein